MGDMTDNVRLNQAAHDRKQVTVVPMNAQQAENFTKQYWICSLRAGTMEDDKIGSIHITATTGHPGETIAFWVNAAYKPTLGQSVLICVGAPNVLKP
jgi:hypothetical protein